ncbi:MAG: DUF1036 domain-containing protein [Hyphomicrobiales bacterium]
MGEKFLFLKGRNVKDVVRAGFLTCVLALTGLFLSTPKAAADLKLCNNTDSRVGVAVGYRDHKGWASEGWWNVGPHSCETLLKHNLTARYYYIYAIDYDKGGAWGGSAMMCTRDKLFTVRGIKDCVQRGYQHTGFFEVDTKEEPDWTVSLSGTAGKPAAPQTN